MKDCLTVDVLKYGMHSVNRTQDRACFRLNGGTMYDDPDWFSAVGVAAYSGRFGPDESSHLLKLEQANQPGQPLGIPAGHVEPDDDSL